MKESRVKPYLKGLYTLLLNLTEKIHDDNFWFSLDKELRSFLRPDNEEAFNILLFEIFRKFPTFQVEDEDTFFQKLSLLRLAYCNHKLKLRRSEMAQEIKVLKLKQSKGLSSTYEDEQLKMLVTLKKKL